MLDCLQVWSEEVAPWIDIAKISMDKIIPNEAIEHIGFSSLNSCQDLSIPTANTGTLTMPQYVYNAV